MCGVSEVGMVYTWCVRAICMWCVWGICVVRAVYMGSMCLVCEVGMVYMWYEVCDVCEVGIMCVVTGVYELSAWCV